MEQGSRQGGYIETGIVKGTGGCRQGRQTEASGRVTEGRKRFKEAGKRIAA